MAVNFANDSDALLRRCAQGDGQALSGLLEQHRARLKRMVELRMDPRLQGRVDASDVIQDAYLQASTRVANYLEERTMPFFLWLRFLVRQRLLELHRFHLGTERRDAKREISLYHAPLAEASSAMLASKLIGSLTAPSHAAVRAEERIRMHEALSRLEPIDREIIALRHFEQLSRSEAAHELDISVAAASKRYIRAMKRLEQMLDQPPASQDL